MVSVKFGFAVLGDFEGQLFFDKASRIVFRATVSAAMACIERNNHVARRTGRFRIEAQRGNTRIGCLARQILFFGKFANRGREVLLLRHAAVIVQRVHRNGVFFILVNRSPNRERAAIGSAARYFGLPSFGPRPGDLYEVVFTTLIGGVERNLEQCSAIDCLRSRH